MTIEERILEIERRLEDMKRQSQAALALATVCVETLERVREPCFSWGGNSSLEQRRAAAEESLATEPAPAPAADQPADALAAGAERPSDEELRDLWSWAAGQDQGPWPTQYHCFARAVLARWGQLPAPPAEGEVAGLVAWLREEADDWSQANPRGYQGERLAYTADLLERHAADGPVPVAERLPEPNTKVLAHYFNDHGKGRTICAIWVPAGSRECTGDDSISEPVEGCWPEGWYELIENWEDYSCIAVNEGEVAYWQPLPKWPANTLPLPAPQGGEVEL